MSQTDLGDKLGVTFQQIQKYERGANRVSCSALAAIADALEAPVAYFFSETPGPTARILDGLQPEHMKAGLKLLHAFDDIQDAKVRQNLVGLAEQLASQSTRGRTRTSRWR
jgi:transcriptional regulator with XRE-family HTH domain